MIKEKLPKNYLKFKAKFSKVWNAYDNLGETLKKEGPLDKKTQELVKLAYAIAAGSEGATHSHTRRALKAGAKKEEILHAAILGITTIGFPRAMAGFSWINDVL